MPSLEDLSCVALENRKWDTRRLLVLVCLELLSPPFETRKINTFNQEEQEKIEIHVLIAPRSRENILDWKIKLEGLSKITGIN